MEWSVKRLQQWLQAQLAADVSNISLKDEKLRVKALPVGLSNEVYALSLGSKKWILRKPPASISHQSAHKVLREYKIIKALARAHIRLPRLGYCCDDLSVIGTEFFLMDWVDGITVNERLSDAYLLAPDSHTGFGFELIDALVELHAVDWRSSGLADIGREEGFLEQQINRWSIQYQSNIREELPQVDRIAHWLRRHLPKQQRSCIIHGDYKLDNLLFSRQPPARAVAIIDWEMATIGDPLLDLGSAMMFWPEPGNPVADQPALRKRTMPLHQLPSTSTLVQRYADATGLDVGAIHYYMVFAAWKRAIILESRYRSHDANATGGDFKSRLEHYIPSLLERAESFCF